MPQTIVIRELASQKSAERFMSRNETVTDAIAAKTEDGKIRVVINKIDEGCFHVELIGNFGSTINLARFQ